MNSRQKAGVIGAGLLFIGVFLPAVHVPVIGSQNYIQNGLGVGALVIALAVVGGVGALSERYAVCFLAGASVLLILAWNLVRFVAGVDALKRTVEELSSTPFDRIGETVVQSVQLQYGFAVLVLGGLTLTAAGAYGFEPGRHPFRRVPRWAFGTLGLISLAALAASVGIGLWINSLEYSSGRAVGEPEVLGPLFLFAPPSLYVVCGVFAIIAALAFMGMSTAGFGRPSEVEQVAGSDATRKCPECAERILADARKCRFCGSSVEPIVVSQPSADEEWERQRRSTEAWLRGDE